MERACTSTSQFGFRARHSTDRVTLNFNNNMSMDAVFLDIEKVFNTTWHLGLLYKLSELKFSISLIKVISTFLSQRNFRVSVEGEIFTPNDIQTGVQQGSVLSPHNVQHMRPKHLVSISVSLLMTPVYIYIYIYIYATDSKKGYVLRKL
jgi:hypothetical protein